MNPYIWGSFYWYFIHIISYHCSDIIDIENFYSNILFEILPCDECKNNYKKYLLKNSIKCKDRKKIILWAKKCHNIVNKKKNFDIITNIDYMYHNINYGKLEVFFNIIKKLYQENIISKKNINIIIKLFPNNKISINLLNNINYKIPNKFINFLLKIKINNKFYICIIPDNIKELTNLKIIYSKSKININLHNTKIIIKNSNKIQNLKLISKSKFDYEQRINKILNKNIYYNFI